MRFRLLRAFLIACLGTSGWFIWTIAHQKSSSCFGASHYLASATVALAAVVVINLAFDTPTISNSTNGPLSPRSIVRLALSAVAAIVFIAIGLLVASLLAAAISCSA